MLLDEMKYWCEQQMYFKVEDYYGRSSSGDYDLGFVYHGNAGKTYGLDCAV